MAPIIKVPRTSCPPLHHDRPAQQIYTFLYLDHSLHFQAPPPLAAAAVAAVVAMAAWDIMQAVLKSHLYMYQKGTVQA